jgi:hypothetical protein
MSNLRNYYQDLLNWEGQPRRELVEEWPHILRESIESAFVNAVSKSGMKGSTCSLSPDSSNQSIGNQVEKYTMEELNTTISEFSISLCHGKGYPDQTLTQTATGTRIPLEVKATSNWNPSDTNRRVLTSSSRKLRTQFSAPIYHLLLTVIYSQNENLATIDAIRLDFLEPTTVVNVRLEASVNHKILATGHHCQRII